MRHRRRLQRAATTRRFTLRMLGTVAATFVLAGLGQYAFGYGQIRDTASDRILTGYRGDAKVLADIHADNPAEPWAPMAELLSHVSHRPGVVQTALLDPHARVVLTPAAHGQEHAGEHEAPAGQDAHQGDGMTGHDAPAHQDDAMADDAIADEPAGNMTGHEPAHEPASDAGSHEDLTAQLAQLASPALSDGTPTAGDLPGGQGGFAVPVHLDGTAYALVVATDGAAVVEHLGDLRLTLLVGLALSLLVGLPAFHVLGGRRLAADHAANVDDALHDALTGLGNHRSFHEAIRTQLAAAERHDQPLVLALFDLDGFKLVNDTAGHRRGDEVLATVGSILADGRSGDVPFRVGGDEFAMILPNTTVDGARVACVRVRDRINAQLPEIGASVGLAAYRTDAADAEALWEGADAAMYQAKRQGKNRVVAFREVDGSDPGVALSMAAELRALLEAGHLDVVFQPIFNLPGSDVIGFEALVRPPAIAGFPGPTEMFETADRLNLVPEVDALCRRSILAAAQDLPEGARLYMNVSPAALDHDLLDWDGLAAQTYAAGLDPSQVVIELTERTRLSGPVMARAVEDIRAAGFSVALDDIGTGWAGFTSLLSLRPDVAKIDRSIVVAAADDPHAAAVLVAVATYASITGIELIAEGVETPEVLSYLQEAHGDLITGVQGFLLGRPAPLHRDAEPSPAPEPSEATSRQR